MRHQGVSEDIDASLIVAMGMTQAHQHCKSLSQLRGLMWRSRTQQTAEQS
jgi:hypothetical protein